jgi:ribosomal-protein-alanine N-acetyltransferase
MRMPALETDRLVVRPFVPDDLAAVHDLLDVQLGDAEVGTEGALSLGERERWLRWMVASYEGLAYLRQPPYGDRAVALRDTGHLVGACGYVPCLGPFNQVPALAAGGSLSRLWSPEFGLYWSIAPRYQRRGLATEAGRALVDWAFSALHLGRIVATTSYDNTASIRVMEKLGMRIERSPSPDPPWFQVVGFVTNPASVDAAPSAIRDQRLPDRSRPGA